MAARAAGASDIYTVEISDWRGAKARSMGAKEVINPNKVDPAQRLRDLTGGIGVDVAIIATPAAQSQVLGVEAVRKRGIVVLFGGLPRESPYATFDSNRIHYDELRVQGSFSYTADGFRRALETIRDGGITPGLYISRVVGLEGITDGIVASERGEVLKVLVAPWVDSDPQGRERPWVDSDPQGAGGHGASEDGI
jgi:L-iditol 2-dehydrogenase